MLFGKGMLNPWQPRANALIGTGVVGGLHPGRIPGLYTTAAPAAPEAAYVAALTAAGATVTAPQQAAISSFMSGEIAAGRWDGIKRLYFPVWGSAASNAICMKSLTSSTFVGVVTHGAGYIQGNGSTGYANTNTTLASVNVTKDSYYAGYLRIEAGGGSEFSFGVSEGGVKALQSADQYLFNEETEQNYFVQTVARVSNNFLNHSDPPSTLLTIGGTTSSRFLKNRTSSGVTTRATSSATNTQELATAEFCLMTINTPTGVSSVRSNSKFGAFFFGTALTDAEDTAYTLNLQNLYNRIRFGIITGLDWQNYADETINYVIELNKAGVAYV